MRVSCAKSRGTGYVQCPVDWHTKDEALLRQTEGTLAGALVRLTGGFNRSTKNFSRTAKHLQISGSAELGWADAASTGGISRPSGGGSTLARRIVHAMALEMTLHMVQAFGSDLATRLTTEAGVDDVFDLFVGRRTMPADATAERFVDGWNAISQTGIGQAIYTRIWFARYVAPVIVKMRERGWNNARTLAAGVRMRNTSTSMMNRIFSQGDTPEAEAVENALDAYANYRDHYQNDVERIRTWPMFQGQVEQWPTSSDLDYGVWSGGGTDGGGAQGWFDWKEPTVTMTGENGEAPTPTPTTTTTTTTTTPPGETQQDALGPITDERPVWPVVAGLVFLFAGTAGAVVWGFSRRKDKDKKKGGKRG